MTSPNIVKVLQRGTIRDFQKAIGRIYGLPDDRLFSIHDLVSNIERFTMRALKGIRKGDKKKLALNLMVGLSWSMALANRLRINLESVLWHRFPNACSYCGAAPCTCKKMKPVKRVPSRPHGPRPDSIVAVQKMFKKIYPSNSRTLADAGVHLAEEVGEVSEAVHTYLGEHKAAQFSQIELELADYWSCAFGVANSANIDVAKELARLYRKNCHVCHTVPCACNFSSVARFTS